MEIRSIENVIKIYPDKFDRYFTLFSALIFFMGAVMSIYLSIFSDDTNSFIGYIVAILFFFISYYTSKKHLKNEPEFILSNDSFWSSDTSYLKWDEIQFFYNKTDVDGDVLYLINTDFKIKELSSNYGSNLNQYLSKYHENKILDTYLFENIKYWIEYYERNIISITELNKRCIELKSNNPVKL